MTQAQPQEGPPLPAAEEAAQLRRRTRGSLADEVLDLRARLDHAQAVLQHRDAAIEALTGSRSWKLTAPLRAVIRRLRPAGAPPPEPPPAELPQPRPEPPPAGAPPLLPAAPDAAVMAAQRAILGLDRAPGPVGVALVAPGGGSPRLHAALAAARLPGPACIVATPAAAFAAGAELALALPDDAALDAECLGRLVQAHLAAGGQAVLEAAAFPDENPRPFDPLTFDIPWLSPHGWALPQAAWAAIGWTDPAMGQAEAAVDLGWRAQAAGFRLRLVPHAFVLLPPPGPPADPAGLAARWDGARLASLAARRWP